MWSVSRATCLDLPPGQESPGNPKFVAAPACRVDRAGGGAGRNRAAVRHLLRARRLGSVAGRRAEAADACDRRRDGGSGSSSRSPTRRPRRSPRSTVARLACTSSSTTTRLRSLNGCSTSQGRGRTGATAGARLVGWLLAGEFVVAQMTSARGSRSEGKEGTRLAAAVCDLAGGLSAPGSPGEMGRGTADRCCRGRSSLKAVRVQLAPRRNRSLDSSRRFGGRWLVCLHRDRVNSCPVPS